MVKYDLLDRGGFSYENQTQRSTLVNGMIGSDHLRVEEDGIEHLGELFHQLFPSHLASFCHSLICLDQMFCI